MKKWSSLLLTGALLFSSGALADIPVDAAPNDWVIIDDMNEEEQNNDQQDWLDVVPLVNWNYEKNDSAKTITLTEYVGQGTEVIIPTAEDLGYEDYQVSISKEVLHAIAKGKTRLRTSDNGDKIIVSTEDLSHCFYEEDDDYELEIVDLTNLDVSHVTNLQGMFRNCTNLTSLDVSNWDTSNVTNAASMFKMCNDLTNLDVSNWDTSSMINMEWMFLGCYNLANLDVSQWDTSHVTNMYGVFDACTSLANLDVSNWDTSNVTNMATMFEGCTNLTNLDVSNWDTSNVTNMATMFKNCDSLTYVPIQNWNMENVDQKDKITMFEGCNSLINKIADFIKAS